MMKTVRDFDVMMKSIIVVMIAAGFALIGLSVVKASRPVNEITISYSNLIDTSGHLHSVQLVLNPDGSVTWRDMTPHLGNR
jgi:hypothetical protein